MAKRKQKQASVTDEPVKIQTATDNMPRSGLIASALYIVIACILTYPLIFRLNGSIYGFYDHVSTDLFASIHYYFWWIREALLVNHASPFFDPGLCAPFGSRVIFTNFTGFLHFPVTAITGALASRNLTILFNLIMSGLGTFFLVRHVTKNAGAAIIAGIIYAFCPNMLVRSYTTFDSTIVQWIPFYLLFLVRFLEDRTWKNAILAGMFLLFNILFAMPYYLVYLPVHTTVLLLSFAAWHIWGRKEGFGPFTAKLCTPEALRNWMKAAAVLAVLIVIFGVYYKAVIGGGQTMSRVQRSTAQLEALALAPTDYLMPHPRSALLKGDIKQSYWDTARPGKDPDSFVAYIGYIALVLAAVGVWKGRGPVRWFSVAGAVVGVWSTLGPHLLGIPTPSGLIHTLYAPFARRILIYKVFVQLSVATLAGLGAAYIFRKLRSQGAEYTVLGVVSLFMLFEYAIVPPWLTVDLTHTPEVYEHVASLPDGSSLIEVPLKRNNGYLYQGYLFYQTRHSKPLFNEYFGLDLVPETLRPFYRQMDVPMEAEAYCNLAALRTLGITHLVNHRHIGTKTVVFRAFIAPGLAAGKVDGLRELYRNGNALTDDFEGPYDYTFADLYEITAEPSPVALAFDYSTPYEPVPGVLDRDGPTAIGWASALLDPSPSFSMPIPGENGMIRLLRDSGTVHCTSLVDVSVTFDITFDASAETERELSASWNGTDKGTFTIGPEPLRLTLSGLTMSAGEQGELSIKVSGDRYSYKIDDITLPCSAELRDFRVYEK